MIEQTDILAERFSAVEHPAENPNWLEVRRRAGSPRRRGWLLVPLAAAIAAVAIGSALGLRQIVDFVSAEPAPERVVVDFGQMSVRSKITLGGPQVRAGEARKITEATFRGKPHALYVAPTEDGGFCWVWEKLIGSCGRTTVGHTKLMQPLSAGWLDSPSGGPARVSGHVLDSAITRLEVVYEDSARDPVSIVWVSEPIDAGFFFFETPPGHLQAGHRVTALVGLDDRGREVARQPFKFSDPRWDSGPDGLPKIADRSAKRTLFDFRDHDGRQWTLVTAPAPGERLCWAYNGGGGCVSPKFRPIVGGMSVQPGGVVNVCCAVAPEVATVELRYEDGTRTALKPVDGFLLYVIPPAHYAVGHRLESLAWLSADGREIAARRFGTRQPGIYPCDQAEEKKLDYGVRICP